MQTPSLFSFEACSAAAEPADPAARCRELARLHGFVVYGGDGRGRYAFHPSRTALPLRFFECWGEDWSGLPLGTHFWAPDLDAAAVLAVGEFRHITRLIEVPAPASSEPEQAELFGEG
jgi:hypothetical protein